MRNCTKIVKLCEKKNNGATDWQNKDVEAQSDSYRALCDIKTSSWRVLSIFYCLWTFLQLKLQFIVMRVGPFLTDTGPSCLGLTRFNVPLFT